MRIIFHKFVKGADITPEGHFLAISNYEGGGGGGYAWFRGGKVTFINFKFQAFTTSANTAAI